MNDIQFRSVKLEDLHRLKNIYTYYIENSTATFHINKISDDEMKKILFSEDNLYESFVIMDGNKIIGYVLLAPYSKREAFRISAEVTIYLDNNVTSKGIGYIALEFIEEVARKKGIRTLLSLICGENYKSVKLFEKAGFYKCAHMKNVGKKFDRILDLLIYEKELL
ncbi:GCN5-related N-acetyltransferase [Clostridium bornimense]|uniref:GCN5-related N-acetyltransferase n=1 Tax=Clostridium bornimense TaxID=1216932 RepID=W6RUD0_9CLOT|nr:GNAT family N-acetyltransferase [Clostridium bornimense]CDM68241.1 GCN5-related N-acetyltransferase [Clostridium bornimense]